MKKFILIFFFARHSLKLLATAGVFIFSFSLCEAQDTLVFNVGSKIRVKVLYVDKLKVYFKEPPDKDIETVNKTELTDIKYANGFVYSPDLNQDSLMNHGQKGHLVINIGVGYSPEFDGDVGFGGLFFPVQRNSEYFSCYSIIPNIGGTVDYGLTQKSSIGLAVSYQSEVVQDNDYSFLNANKISRTNFAVRFLKHLNKRHPNFDNYFGLRVGCSYWVDKPISSGENQNLAVSIPFYYFLETPNSLVPSIQFLFGMRFYFNDTIGIHIEAGIGSPYLVESGISFRFKTQKGKAN